MKEVFIIKTKHSGNRCIICQDLIAKNGKNSYHIQLGRHIKNGMTRNIAGRFKINWRKHPVKLHIKCAIGIEEEVMTVLARGYKNRIKPHFYPNPNYDPYENNRLRRFTESPTRRTRRRTPRRIDASVRSVDYRDIEAVEGSVIGQD
jgi:predicted adenine nucleotide alpha hydrolase (AANH) superfamily ATPase